MQLRNLFNAKRFNGCVNRRADWVSFEVDADRALSLTIEETSAGEARMMVQDSGASMPPEASGVPEYVLGRIRLWNQWASAALEYEYEQDYSLYGLEAYGISIAVDIARAFPKRPVSYCGLRVHDDYALYQYAARRSYGKGDWPADLPPIPLEDTCNRYMTALKNEPLRTPPLLPPETYVLHRDWDYGTIFFYFDVAENSPYEVSHKVEITPEDGFPEWLAEQAKHLDELWGGEPFHGWQCYHPTKEYWCASPLLDSFCTDALSIDVARYIEPRVPVSCSARYVTGRDVLPFCRP